MRNSSDSMASQAVYNESPLIHKDSGTLSKERVSGYPQDELVTSTQDNVGQTRPMQSNMGKKATPRDNKNSNDYQIPQRLDWCGKDEEDSVSYTSDDYFQDIKRNRKKQKNLRQKLTSIAKKIANAEKMKEELKIMEENSIKRKFVKYFDMLRLEVYNRDDNQFYSVSKINDRHLTLCEAKKLFSLEEKNRCYFILLPEVDFVQNEYYSNYDKFSWDQDYVKFDPSKYDELADSVNASHDFVVEAMKNPQLIVNK